MPNQLSTDLLYELYAQQSTDPFLVLLTLTTPSGTTLRFVNDVVNLVSNGNTFTAFPMRIVLPRDDGESVREITIEFDNVGRTLISTFRTMTEPASVQLDLVLASMPDQVQVSFSELKIQSITYNAQTISCKLFMDSFLNTELTSERYAPSNFPGIF